MSLKLTLTSLPNRRLTVQEVNSINAANNISQAAAIAGLIPNPKQNVIAIYIGKDGTSNFAIFEPETEDWVIRERISVTDQHLAPDFFRQMGELIEDRYPDQKWTVLQPDFEQPLE